jgi:AcrR family transcriptional regulator
VVAASSTPSETRRTPLSRERVLRVAVDVADGGGIDALSMRRLGQELGVDPMALYRHVRNKDDLLDGIVDAIVGEISAEPPAPDWKPALRRQILQARAVMLGHPWAPRVLEERPLTGPAVLAYIDAILGILQAGGFPIDLAHHTLHLFGSRILGFNQDLFDDSASSRLDAAESAAFAASIAGTLPNVARLAIAVGHDGGLGGCDDDVEFVFGLDLIFDGLERLRAAG